MKLSLPFFGKKEQREYFLALLLRDEKVSAVIFEQTNGTIKTLTSSYAQCKTSIEDADSEELLEIVDKALSTAENTLPENIETQKTVFGLKESWIEDTHIKKEYLARLKRISEELDLKPIGFLVFSEALAHLLQKEEGAPVSGILVDVGEKIITVSLLRAGRIIETIQETLTETIPAQVDSMLKKFANVEILPSRIIFYNDTDSDTLAQKFLSHSWSKTLPFLHVPQITSLAKGFDAKAILFGAATQMGFSLSYKEEKEIASLEAVEKHGRLTKQTIAQEEISQDQKQPDTEFLDKKEQEASEKEIESDKKEEQSQEKEDKAIDEKTKTKPLDASFFGFVKDGDVTKETVQHPHASQLPSDGMQEVTEEIPQEVKDTLAATNQADQLPLDATLVTKGMKNIITKVMHIFKSMPKEKREIPRERDTATLTPQESQKGDSSFAKQVPLIVIGLILFGCIGAGAWYYFSVKATVTIFVNPKSISQDKDVIFSTSANTSAADAIIGGEIVSVSEDGNQSTQTTGTKEIGDKAKGTVTIFNSSTDGSKTFPAGTTITSSNSLKFIVSKDVTIASASGDIFSGTTPGKADVDVVASDIGTEYNLPSDTKFTVGGAATVAAKNASAFSGGTKKNITVVSKDDTKKLLDQLTSSLQDKAKNDIAQQVGSDKVILPVFIKFDVPKQSFDQKVDSEAKNVTLTGTVTYQTIAFKKTDMQGFIKSALHDQFPADAQVSDNGLTFEVNNPKQKNDHEVTASLTMHAAFLPEIDIQNIAKEISGKSFANATTTIAALPQVASSSIVLSPHIPLITFLPQNVSHIAVVVKTNE